MTAVAIDRFVARYAVPPHAARDRSRLQGVLADAISRVLEGAIERAGLPRDGDLCIRDVHATVTVALRQSDGALADQIGDSIAGAIRAAVAGTSPSVVFYRSRAHALIDLAVGAVQGRFDRSWAWRQLGLWHADGPLRPDLAAGTVLRALAATPTLAVPVIVHLAQRHVAVVDALVTRTTADAWLEVARATLVAAGAHADLLASAATVVPPAGEVGAAAQTVMRSAIARAIVPRHVDLATGVRRAIAVLALLETEPAALGVDAGHARHALAAATHALRVGRRIDPIRPAPAPQDEDNLRGTATRLDPDAPARVDHGAVEGTAPGDRTTDVERAVGRIDDESLERPDSLDGAGLAIRRRARSRAAGLLYLLNVVGRVDLPQSALADTRLASRGLRWILHQIGVALSGADAADPAVLAFAGLPPDAAPPSAQEAPATDDEHDAIARQCTVITDALRDLLRRNEAEADPIAVVCRRPADIVCDPGWIDVRFARDEVSTDIRRAGLDRDPGWIPWLGVAVRFIYA